MTPNRRQVIGAIGAFPGLLALQPRHPQVGVCSGFVRGNGGPWTVELRDSHGGVETTATDPGDGWYSFKNPATNPYLLTFRDRNSNIVREVRWLTENLSQNVCVTIDTSLKEFDSAYGALQAIESLLAFFKAYPPAASKSDVKYADVMNSLKRLRDAIGPLSGSDFLRAKANNIELLAKTVLA